MCSPHNKLVIFLVCLPLGLPDLCGNSKNVYLHYSSAGFVDELVKNRPQLGCTYWFPDLARLALSNFHIFFRFKCIVVAYLTFLQLSSLATQPSSYLSAVLATFVVNSFSLSNPRVLCSGRVRHVLFCSSTPITTSVPPHNQHIQGIK